MSRRGKKLRRYMGYVGVALCEMRDGTERILPAHIAHQSIETPNGAVVRIIEEAAHIKDLTRRP